MSQFDESGVLSRVLDIIGRRLDIPPGAIDPNAAIVQDLGADSLDILFIAGEIESRFDVKVPDAVIEAARTPVEIAQRLLSHLQHGPEQK